MGQKAGNLFQLAESLSFSRRMNSTTVSLQTGFNGLVGLDCERKAANNCPA